MAFNRDTFTKLQHAVEPIVVQLCVCFLYGDCTASSILWPLTTESQTYLQKYTSVQFWLCCSAAKLEQWKCPCTTNCGLKGKNPLVCCKGVADTFINLHAHITVSVCVLPGQEVPLAMQLQRYWVSVPTSHSSALLLLFSLPPVWLTSYPSIHPPYLSLSVCPAAFCCQVSTWCSEGIPPDWQHQRTRLIQ